MFDAIACLGHSLFMVINFSPEISAECNLRDLVALSPLETAEANAWFDQREAEMEDRWLDAAYEARTEMDF